MSTDTDTTAADTNTTTGVEPVKPVQPGSVEGMTSTKRVLTAMQELAGLVPQVFPECYEENPNPVVIGLYLSPYEMSVHVPATVLVDAHMTGKVVCVETREVYHNGPSGPATLHYEAWLPALLPVSKMRVKIVACEGVGKG